MIPKVIFEPMSLDENIDIVKWAFFENGDTLNLHDSTVYYFPELAEISLFGDKNTIYKKIESIVRKYYHEKWDIILSDVKRYSLLWDKYNKVFFEKICEYLNVGDIDIDTIDVTVGYIPVCPRNIHDNSFSLSIGTDDIWLLHLCAHEILHFVWFKKWSALYPDCPSKQFDSPYLPWKYSEMVTDFILNSECIRSVFDNKFKANSYDSFYHVIDNDNRYMMDVLRDIFNSDLSIEDKIKNGYDYICSINSLNNL